MILYSANRVEAAEALDELLPLVFPPTYGVSEWQGVLDGHLLIGNKATGQLLGPGGTEMVQIRMKSGTSIRIFSEYAPDYDERVLKISGAPSKVKAAIALILESLELSSLYHPARMYIPHPKHDVVQPIYGGFNTNAATAFQHNKYIASHSKPSQPYPLPSKRTVIPPTASLPPPSTSQRSAISRSYRSRPRVNPIRRPKVRSKFYQVIDEVMDDIVSTISDGPLPPSPPRIRTQLNTEPQLSEVVREVMDDAMSTISEAPWPPSPPTIHVQSRAKSQFSESDALHLAILPPHTLVNKRFLPPPMLVPSQILEVIMVSWPAVSWPAAIVKFIDIDLMNY